MDKDKKETGINDEYQQRLLKRTQIAELGIKLHPENFLNKISSELAKIKAE